MQYHQYLIIWNMAIAALGAIINMFHGRNKQLITFNCNISKSFLNSSFIKQSATKTWVFLLKN